MYFLFKHITDNQFQDLKKGKKNGAATLFFLDFSFCTLLVAQTTSFSLKLYVHWANEMLSGSTATSFTPTLIYGRVK